MGREDPNDEVTPPVAQDPSPAEETQSQLGPAVDAPLLHRNQGTLTVVSGPSLGCVLGIDGDGSLTIGRGRDASLRIDDLGLSRRHARVSRSGDTFYVEDLGSKNGVYVEGAKVESQHPLHDGDRIQLGKTTLVKFSLQDPLEQQAALQVYEWTMRDPLTGAYNRRYFDERAREEFAYASRHRTQVSLLLLDLDLFKRVNDTRGHRAGDLVLSALARFLTRALRAEDVAARYGGEEFAILLRDIPHDQALRLADRIRRSVEVLAIPWEGTTLRVTVSVGVGTLAPETGEGSVEHLIEIADRALYRAKQGGRNQVSD